MDFTSEKSSKEHDFIRTKSIFEAAVSTVKNMPQEGPFKPSYATMKTFYGLYKQATVGPCSGKKPSLFDPVGRAKWDAWSSLGDLSKEAAMMQYADEFVRELLVNSQTDNVKQFFETLINAPKTAESEQFISAIKPFLEAVSPNINGDSHMVLSPNINGDAHTHDSKDVMDNDIGDSKSNGSTKSNDIAHNTVDNKVDNNGTINGADSISNHLDDDTGDNSNESIELDDLSSGSDNEDFCDTLDQIEISDEEISLQTNSPAIITSDSTHLLEQANKNFSPSELPPVPVLDRRQNSNLPTVSSNQQLLHVLENIQRDMTEMINRIKLLEKQLKKNISNKQEGKLSSTYFGNLTPKQIAVYAFLICVWPFVIRWFIKYIWRKKH